MTVAGLLLATVAVVVGTTVIPTHVTFGARALRCGTVLRPDRKSEIAPICGPAGANHLWAAWPSGRSWRCSPLCPWWPSGYALAQTQRYGRDGA